MDMTDEVRAWLLTENGREACARRGAPGGAVRRLAGAWRRWMATRHDPLYVARYATRQAFEDALSACV